MPWSSGGCKVHSEQGAIAAKETNSILRFISRRCQHSDGGDYIPLCSAAVKPHPVLSFSEQDRHGHTEASSWNDCEDYEGVGT